MIILRHMIMSLLSIKVPAISSGLIFLSLAMGMGIIIFSVHEIPEIMWCAINLSWLKPPYLHLIANAIIISIVASARFRRRTQYEPPPEHLITVKTPPPLYYGSLSVATIVEEFTADETDHQDRVVELEPVAMNGSSVDVIETKEVLDEAKNVIIDSVPAHSSPSQEIISPEPQLQLLYPLEKPVLSPRLRHGNLFKTSPQRVKTAREPEPKRQETLESIWKMITEKRHAEHACAQIGNLERTKQLRLEALPGSERAVAESRIASLKASSRNGMMK